MTSLIDLTPSILIQNNICFELRNLDTENIPVPIENSKFGILNFQAVTCSEVDDELDFLFTVDCSGSMSDLCSDRKSKMNHIIHTLKNMIMFFHERPHIKINITIQAFDTFIYEIIERTKINKENIIHIISKIEQIYPRGSTNIELALEESYNKITQLKTLYPDNVITHIFMTDGEATDGSNDINILKSKVSKENTNAFIGFGIEHDSCLLNGISSIGKSGYYFIDKLENAGLVYGEILHSIIYKILDNVQITIENGLIYDFKTNKWVQSLTIGNIVSESNKTFNIISPNPDECKVNIKGSIKNLEIIFPSVLKKITEDNNEFICHIYRQRTLQLLYEVNEFCIKKREKEYDNYRTIFNFRNIDDNMDENNISKERKCLKLKLSNLMEEIKKYMIDNNLIRNKILKNLCDDIYICYRTLGTKYGSMFCTARQTSQGTQRQYTASNTLDINDTNDTNVNNNSRRRLFPPSLLRQTNYDFIEPDILNHEVSDFCDTPYLSQQATQVMSEISNSFDDNFYSEETQKM
jgi:hypothetical protein